MYKLIISDDEGKTTVVPLIRDEVTIGRSEGNTIRLTDRNISRFHARVIRRDDDFFIEDLRSLCGTKVNAKLLKADRLRIVPGDKIAIGDYSLSIRTDVATDVPMGKQIESGSGAGIGKVTPHARLVVLSEPVPGKEIELTADLYVIGRSSDANCQIKDSSISRAHARIDLDAGEWTISDLDSFNGILINGGKKDDYVLKAGDVIELGNVQIRYVAPGEPFEFDPDDGESSSGLASSPPEPVSKGSPRKLLLLLVGIAIVAVIAIVAIVIPVGSGEAEVAEEKTNSEIIEDATFEELMEKGKDAMQSEDWAGAAKLFALAMRKAPNNSLAKEFKEQSVKESDAKVHFNDGLAAEAKEDWSSAYSHFAAIPRSSHYYEEAQLKHISAKYCEHLLEQLRKAIELDRESDVKKHIGVLAGIEEAPEECKQETTDLEAFYTAMRAKNKAPPPPVNRRVVQPVKKKIVPKTTVRERTTKPPPSKPPASKPSSNRPINPYE